MIEITEAQKEILKKEMPMFDAWFVVDDLDSIMDELNDLIAVEIVNNNDEPTEKARELQTIFDEVFDANYEHD